MNNYPDFRKFNYTDMYNKMNNLFNQNIDNDIYKEAYEDNNNLYDPYNGFIRGNLFKDLYDPYKLKVPYEVKPMNEQASMLTDIDALGFAMIDLNLYLDIYPDDRKAINLFNQYRKQKEGLMEEYESKYGPINLNSESLNKYPWAWDDMPWPWDN